MLDQILGFDLSALVWSEITVTRILDFIGTFAFAISGIRLASTKQMDWFGAYVLGVTMGFPSWVAVIMGTVTGSFGGLLRDIILNETPLICRQDIYALACIIGGIVYTLMLRFIPIDIVYAQLVSAGLIILIRILAAYYHWHLPQLKGVSSSK